MKLAYSVDEAAVECGVSSDVIRRAVKAGHLIKAHPKGGAKGEPIGKYVIRHADLVAWLEDAPGEKS